MANINQQEQQRLALLQEIEQAERRINAQNEKIAVSKAKEAKRIEKMMQDEKKHLDNLKEELKTTEKLLDANKKRAETAKKHREFVKEIQDENENELKSFSKLSTRVKEALKDEKTGFNALASVSARIQDINSQILDRSRKGKKLTNEEAEAQKARLSSLFSEKEALKQQRESLLAQVQSYLDIKDSAKGMSAEAKEEMEFRETIKDFDLQTRANLMNLYRQRQAFLAQEKKIKEIQSGQKAIIERLPDGIKSIITTVKEFLTLVGEIGMVWAGLAAIFALGVMAMQELSKAAKKFREDTGILNSQMKDIKDKVSEVTQEMAQLGVEAQDVYDVVTELKKEFGDIANISKDTVRALTILKSNFGVANEDAVAFVAQLEAMTGLSEQAAANYALQVTQVAKLAKVAPKQLFKDIAESAKDTSEYFGSSFDNMAKTALEARRLGTNLKEVMGVSEKLLDFESSIEQELKASAFAQGQFNLTQARALAATKNYSGALDEVLNQMQRGERFADKDLYTQRELAKAVGTTPAVIQKMIAQRERLANLGDEEKKLAEQAIENGFDITNASKEQLQLAINKLKTEQEMQGQLSRITNAFKGIGMVIGTAVLPFLETALMILQPFASFLMGVVNAFGKLGGLLNGFSKSLFGASEFGRTLFKILKGVAMAAIVAGAGMMALSGNVVGSVTLVIAGSSFLNGISIDDGSIDNEGNVVSTPKGTVRLNSEDTFVGNKNGVVAGTNLFGNTPRPSSFATQGSSQQMNLAMVSEVKALRNDLKTGGIQANAYLGTSKVNDVLTGYQSKTTYNNFNI